jgi:hypothetical protein
MAIARYYRNEWFSFAGNVLFFFWFLKEAVKYNNKPI